MFAGKCFKLFSGSLLNFIKLDFLLSDDAATLLADGPHPTPRNTRLHTFVFPHSFFLYLKSLQLFKGFMIQHNVLHVSYNVAWVVGGNAIILSPLISHILKWTFRILPDVI